MALVLAGIVFTDYAIPERVKLGGAQKFVTHKLMGGTRVVDAMGPDDADIPWSGRFQGPGAVEKAMALDQLRKSGAQVPLIVDSQFYMVGVKHFTWDYERSYQIIYKIVCLVVSSMGGEAPFAATLDSLVLSDMTVVSAVLSDFAAAV
jgi:hypothetical protein